MALNLVVIGYLFGCKRRQDPRALHLLNISLPHLAQQIAYLPPGGYNGEGSTYTLLVAASLMALACAVLEEITGENWYNRPLGPYRNTIAKFLENACRFVMPSGLFLPWDQHGYSRHRAGSPAAYVAFRTGQPAIYAPYADEATWYYSAHSAWMRDDHVWQWLWMPTPENYKKVINYRSWAEERVGGALSTSDGSLYLFQMWDVSGPRPVRSHMNPNSIILEAWGSQLTVDGNSVTGFPLDNDPRMQFLHYYGKEPRVMSWSAGSLGAHSTIWIDEQIDHTPGWEGFHHERATTGYLVRFADKDDLRILAAEAAPFYRKRFDLKSWIRMSALVANKFWFIYDRLLAESEHNFTWQMVLRQGAIATDYGARLITPEAVVLDIFHLDGAPSSLHDIKGYPSTLEQRCHHLRKGQRGREIEFITVLIPQEGRRLVADWAQGWQRIPDSKDDIACWRRLCDLRTLPTGRRWLLELPCTAGDMHVAIDNNIIALPPCATHHPREPRLLPAFVDITEYIAGKESVSLYISGGDPLLAICAPKVRLYCREEVAVPAVQRHGGKIEVKYRDVMCIVDLDYLTCPSVPLPAKGSAGEDPLVAVRPIQEKVAARLDACATTFASKTISQEDAANLCVLAMCALNGQISDDSLLRLLDHTDWVVRMLAIAALGKRRAQCAVPRLVEILHQETAKRIKSSHYAPRYRLKEMCIHALREIGDPRAAPDIAACLTPEDFYGSDA